MRVVDFPQMDKHIQVGPTGKKLLPLTVKNAAAAPIGHSH
ncbi:TIGR03960 family B12-binding radical SAM protein OS=Streptomyces chartreusis OX=1969 GN=HUT05_32030 PE=4 SV=1 [Streptomyces chartreusis]